MITFAQIGVGYWGPNILRNLDINDDVYIKYVVEISSERAKFVKENYNSIIVTDKIEIVLKDPEVNAVVISTPVETHFNLARKCLQAGKHILVEKPMAKTSNEVEDIIQLAKKNNLIAMVGHTFLYNSAVRKVKEIIDKGEIGDIRYIYSQRLNLGRIRNDVDVLWNLAPHDISIIQFWLGDPDTLSVHRNGMSYIQKEIDDVVFLNIEYPKKIIAHIHVSWLDPHKIRKMTVVGSKKMIVYDDIGDIKVTVHDKGIDEISVLGKKMDYDKSSVPKYVHRSDLVKIPYIDWVEPLKVEIAHFIDCIENGTKCLTDGVHAKSVVKILEKGS